MAPVVTSLVLVLALLVASEGTAYAQMELAVIKGTIVDEAGAPIEGAAIRLRNVDRGREVTVTSDKNGRFYRRGLQAVEYEMSVEKEGYQPVADKIRLVAGADRDFDFTLAKATPRGAEEFQQGVEAYNKGDFLAAAGAFEAAIAKAPEIPDLHVNLALAYFRLDRQNDAVAHLERASSLGPNDARIHYQLGSAYIEMQAYDKAAASLERGLATRPDLANDALAVEATSSLGAVYFAQGDVDRAAAQFDKVLAVRPEAAGATLGMAKVLFSRGDAAKALALFEQVVAQHPGTPEAAQAAAFVKELKKPVRSEPQKEKEGSDEETQWLDSGRGADGVLDRFRAAPVAGAERRRRRDRPVRSGGELAAELLRRGVPAGIDGRRLGREP